MKYKTSAPAQQCRSSAFLSLRTHGSEMKAQTLLTTLCCLLFSSSGKQLKDSKSSSGSQDSRDLQKSNIIYHNGHPVHVHSIPQSGSQNYGLHTQASDTVHNKATPPAPKVALQRNKIVIQNQNAYLQDSYGNRYHTSPQNLAYKQTFPQQYVSLQDLPGHLSQPLQGPTLIKQSYTLPRFDTGRKQPLIFDFSKAPQLAPIVLKEVMSQHVNVPVQSNYKIGSSGPVANGNHPQTTYSFHTGPFQRYVSAAPESFPSGINFYNSRPNDNFLNQKVYFSEPQQESKSRPSSVKPERHQELRQSVPDHAQYAAPQKNIDPQYYKPQTFSNPIVPQVQHFLPYIESIHNIDQNPFHVSIQTTKNKPQQQEPVEQHPPIQRNLQKPPPLKSSDRPPTQRNVEHPANTGKHVIINEYTSPPKHEHKEEVKSEVINEEENDEKNFDEGYHEAAKGFPSFYHEDNNKNYYDESSYGEPSYHDSLPYGPPDDHHHEDPDELHHHSAKYVNTVQKNTYSDSPDNDDQKENEYKPVPYYLNDPNTHFSKNYDKSLGGKTNYDGPKLGSKIIQQEHEFPLHFGSRNQDSNQRLRHQKESPQSARYEVDYSKGYPKSQQFKSHQHSGPTALFQSPRVQGNSPTARFVEPQYQYGFEPIFAREDTNDPFPSASNNTPETEKHPSSVKKIYKENWSISKESSSDAGTGS